MNKIKEHTSVDWGCACGRTYLTVGGFVVAVEGDICRDNNLDRIWDGETIKSIADKFNEGQGLPERDLDE